MSIEGIEGINGFVTYKKDIYNKFKNKLVLIK